MSEMRIYFIDRSKPLSCRCDAVKNFLNRKMLSLSQLPEKTREILSLSRMAGLSNHQIAKRTKLSEKSVEYHISKCIKLLRRHLQDFLAVLVILVEC